MKNYWNFWIKFLNWYLNILAKQFLTQKLSAYFFHLYLFSSFFVFLPFVSIIYVITLHSRRMERSHSRAEATVSTESFPMSTGSERRLHLQRDVTGCHQTPACSWGSFDVSPQLQQSAQGFQRIVARYQGSKDGTPMDRGRGHTQVVGCGASRVFRNTCRSWCHSTHRPPGGKSWEWKNAPWRRIHLEGNKLSLTYCLNSSFSHFSLFADCIYVPVGAKRNSILYWIIICYVMLLARSSCQHDKIFNAQRFEHEVLILHHSASAWQDIAEIIILPFSQAVWKLLRYQFTSALLCSFLFVNV